MSKTLIQRRSEGSLTNNPNPKSYKHYSSGVFSTDYYTVYVYVLAQVNEDPIQYNKLDSQVLNLSFSTPHHSSPIPLPLFPPFPRRITSSISLPLGVPVTFSYPTSVIKMSSSILTPPTLQ